MATYAMNVRNVNALERSEFLVRNSLGMVNTAYHRPHLHNLDCKMNHCCTIVALLLSMTKAAEFFTLKNLVSQLALTDFGGCVVVRAIISNAASSQDLEIFETIASQRELALVNYKLANQSFGDYRRLMSRKGASCALNLAFLSTNSSTNQVIALLHGIGVRSSDFYVLVATDLQIVRQRLLRTRYAIIVSPTNIKGVQVLNLCSYCSVTTPLHLQILYQPPKTGSELFIDFTMNLWGLPIRLYPFHSEPDLEIEVGPNGQHRLKRGLHVDLMKLVASVYNFTFYIADVSGKGKKLPEEILEEDLADIALICAVTAERIYRVDLTKIIYNDKVSFISALPEARLGWDTVLGGLEYEMYFIIISIPVAVMTVYLIMRFKTIVGMVDRAKWTRRAILSLALKSLAHQDHRSFVTDHSLRSFLSCWLLYNVVISVIYESQLISALMHPRMSIIPENFAQLADREDFYIIFNTDYGYPHRMLSTSTNPVYSTIFQRSELETNISSCLLRAILTPKTVCVGYHSTAIFYAETRKELSTKFVISSDNAFFIMATWMMRKDSLLTRNINKVISSVVSMELVGKLMRMDFAQVRKSNNKKLRQAKNYGGNSEQVEPEVALNLEQLKTVALCGLGGLALSALAFLCELVLGSYAKLKLWAFGMTSSLRDRVLSLQDEDSCSILSVEPMPSSFANIKHLNHREQSVQRNSEALEYTTFFQ